MKRVLYPGSLLPLLFLILFLNFLDSSCAAPVNGDFSSGLTSWTTADLINSCFISPSQSVTADSGYALLETSGYGSGVKMVSLAQSFSFPVSSRSLFFDIGFWTQNDSDAGGNGSETFPDFFQVSWLDEDSGQSRRLLSLDRDGLWLSLDTMSVASLADGWFRIAVNAEELSGRSGSLYFDLSDQDDNRLSKAGVDNVRVQVVPLPATLFLLCPGLSVIFLWIRKRKGI